MKIDFEKIPQNIIANFKDGEKFYRKNARSSFDKNYAWQG